MSQLFTFEWWIQAAIIAGVFILLKWSWLMEDAIPASERMEKIRGFPEPVRKKEERMIKDKLWDNFLRKWF